MSLPKKKKTELPKGTQIREIKITTKIEGEAEKTAIIRYAKEDKPKNG